MNIILSLLIFGVILIVLNVMARRHIPYATRVFTGLGLGVIFGLALQWFFGATSETISKIIAWTNLVGEGYVLFLQMLVIPLVFISMVRAFTTMEEDSAIGKIGAHVLALLVGTVMIAAIVGMASVLLFHLDGATFTQGVAESARIEGLYDQQAQVVNLTLPQQILQFIPKNVFEDFAGLRPTSTISVVIFSIFVGTAYRGVRRKQPEHALIFEKMIDSFHAIVMRIVTLVLRLAPYGIFALMTKMMATSSGSAMINLGTFVVALYVALAVMFGIHLLVLLLFGISPIQYIKKAAPILSFAFTSRSSAGALPFNIRTQVDVLGVDAPTANFSATFGLSIGQNGCAGIYPAMLIAMVTPTAGIDITNPIYGLTVIGTIAISSFGVAGVGGGATFAALIAFGTLGLPVEMIGLLVSVEPIIDMGRTALNVSDSMIAGLVTSKRLGFLDEKVLHDDQATVTVE
ncbi:L-cystine transporter [Allofustis seminis]|uniref:L-cystine transporter n=1 Tax=Allofustis seminis TaxID=166939 RepID=UPI0003678072|nr:cation:dicarboxylase symporter family transporter [Allofustis seminis]